MNGRSQRRVDEGIERIRQKQRDVHVTGVAADLGTREGVEKLTNAVPEIDILVNNLGIYEAKPFSEITDDEWLRVFEINVMSGVRLSRFYLPGMLKRNWGRIVFISSESALNIPVEMIHYGVTKTAQISLSRGLAETTGGTNVTVNSVLAGPTLSEGIEGFLQQMVKAQGSSTADVEKEIFRSVRPSSLLKRFAQSGRSRDNSRLCVQPVSVGNERRSPASGWRRCAVDRVTHPIRLSGGRQCQRVRFPLISST